jgi:hypothetical protein
VSSDIVIARDATLVVCPETRVEMAAGAVLLVRGVLDVRGTDSGPAMFTSGATSPGVGDWGGIHIQTELGGTASMSGALVEFASDGLYIDCCEGTSQSVTVRDSTFRSNDRAIAGERHDAQVTVVDSTFLDNRLAVVRGNKEFRGCTFSGNDQVADELQYNWTFIECTITGNRYGLVGGYYSFEEKADVERCLIADNLEVGLHQLWRGMALRENTIVRNGVGILADLDNAQYSPTRHNHICGNTSHDVELASEWHVDVADNWWCTTDRDAIASQIWDMYDDSSLGQAPFEPFLSEPPPDAPAP